MATLQEEIAEAEQALHDLSIGKQVVQLWDSNGERVHYTPATRPELIAHIANLQGRASDARAVLSVMFKTSKGV